MNTFRIVKYTAVAVPVLLAMACAPHTSTDQQVSDARSAGAGSASEPAIRPVLEAPRGEVPQSRPESTGTLVTEAALAAKARASLTGDAAFDPVTASTRYAVEPLDRENYAHFSANPVKRVAESPVSTFSIDVDTGAYSVVRRMLNAGRLPVRDTVRVEELLNYFSYDYPQPASQRVPFRVTTETGPTPWNRHTRLLHIGIKGYEVAQDRLPPANLVFLVDVSGSMQSANKLQLLKSALKLLSRQLRRQDRIALVVYAGASGVVLESTPGDRKASILRALDGLRAGGPTHGAAGIRLAYELAENSFIEGGINRVLLATDGDFNVGTVNFSALKDLVETRRRSGVTLTTLGFGSGNYNDHLMEQLADAGNGNYAYIDTLAEARKVLVEAMSSTLQTIAGDVKIQVEFNPARVAEYRLVGYENRALRREDFNNDNIDAGDIGAGHSVTAIYEISLSGDAGQRIDPLRYGRAKNTRSRHADELALLRMRYKMPGSHASHLLEHPIRQSAIKASLDTTTENYRFAAAVAGFGQLLRGGRYLESYSYNDVLALARGARGSDPAGYRGEFLGLVSLAGLLDGDRVTEK